MLVALMSDSGKMDFHKKELELSEPIKKLYGAEEYIIIDIDMDRFREILGMSGFDFKVYCCGLESEKTDIIIEIMDITDREEENE